MDNVTKHWLLSSWEGELTLPHLVYVVLDAFVSYNSYTRVSTMRECLILEEILEDLVEDLEPRMSNGKKKIRRGRRIRR